jgi:hypothetical protein
MISDYNILLHNKVFHYIVDLAIAIIIIVSIMFLFILSSDAEAYHQQEYWDAILIVPATNIAVRSNKVIF